MANFNLLSNLSDNNISYEMNEYYLNKAMNELEYIINQQWYGMNFKEIKQNTRKYNRKERYKTFTRRSNIGSFLFELI